MVDVAGVFFSRSPFPQLCQADSFALLSLLLQLPLVPLATAASLLNFSGFLFQ